MSLASVECKISERTCTISMSL